MYTQNKQTDQVPGEENANTMLSVPPKKKVAQRHVQVDCTGHVEVMIIRD